MLVNSINTELLCGEPKRRPVKILFHPASEQNSLDNCGDQVTLVKRKTMSVFDFQFVIAGRLGEVRHSKYEYCQEIIPRESH